MPPRDLSRHQEKIVKRYYQHRDALMAQKLGELVSDLYMADTDKKRASLWSRVEKALANLPKEAAGQKLKAELAVEKQDLKLLAELVNEVAGS